MNDILFDYLDEFCIAYLDDIFIYFENAKEHTKHVWIVFKRLRKARLQANIKKCKFSVSCTKYLSYIVSTKSIEVDLKKICALQE
jgi:hypothetical protein